MSWTKHSPQERAAWIGRVERLLYEIDGLLSEAACAGGLSAARAALHRARRWLERAAEEAR